MDEKPEYRVFISHSSEDADKVELIKEVLISNGLKPFYSGEFEGGDNFFELIEKYIAHSHIFLPLISDASSSRGWVHEEIGIAMALHIPFVPISIDKLPAEMMYHLNAVCWVDDFYKLKEKLNYELFARKIKDSKYKNRPLLECGLKDQDRTDTMVKYANDVLSFKEHGTVRQMARVSSFHIPNTYPTDPILKIHLPNIGSGSSHESLIAERVALEEHAKVKGCKLIINPCETVKRSKCESAILRIRELIRFLEDMDDDKVEIAIRGTLDCSKKDSNKIDQVSNIDKNLTIVGDWFFAESILSPAEEGHPWTIFVRHAPTILESIDNFDKELHALMNKQDRKGDSSRRYVIMELKRICRKLE